ncbi:4515_t:CDS:2, partial [Acaulospora colombiana]
MSLESPSSPSLNGISWLIDTRIHRTLLLLYCLARQQHPTTLLEPPIVSSDLDSGAGKNVVKRPENSNYGILDGAPNSTSDKRSPKLQNDWEIIVYPQENFDRKEQDYMYSKLSDLGDPKEDVRAITHGLATGITSSFIAYFSNPRHKWLYQVAVKVIRGMGANSSSMRVSPTPKSLVAPESNVLIDDKGRGRICDFGLAMIFSDGMANSTQLPLHTVTMRYFAYELITADEATSPTKASDVFAVGCLGLQVTPYSNRRNPAQIYKDIASGVPPAIVIPTTGQPSELVEMLWKFLNKCWSIDPDARPLARDLEKFVEIYGTDLVKAVEAGWTEILDAFGRRCGEDQ